MPHELIYRNAKSAQTKIAQFQQAGASKLHIVFDFDHTLTVGRPGIGGDITTWQILREHLPPPRTKPLPATV